MEEKCRGSVVCGQLTGRALADGSIPARGCHRPGDVFLRGDGEGGLEWYQPAAPDQRPEGTVFRATLRAWGGAAFQVQTLKARVPPVVQRKKGVVFSDRPRVKGASSLGKGTDGQENKKQARGRRGGRQESSPEVFPAPKATGGGRETTPSEGRASLGPGSPKEQGWGEAEIPRQSGRKFKSSPDTCLLNTYYVPALGWGMGTSPPQGWAACSTHAPARPPKPPSPGQGAQWQQREGVVTKTRALRALLPKTMASPKAAQSFLFPSFPSAASTTSGFEIRGDTRADEFTARCWLLECTTVCLIQSTRNHRAPPPPGPWAPPDVTSPCEEPAKTIPSTAAGSGMEKNWVGGKSRSRTTTQRIQIRPDSER